MPVPQQPSYPTMPQKRLRFTADRPYPSVAEISQDRSILPMILFDYASGKGKLTCVTQYTYQSIVLKPSNATLSDTLSQIALVKLRHLHILGDLIVALGGRPRFICPHFSQPVVWNASMPQYASECIAMLEQDIEMEQQTVRMFTQQLEKINSPAVCHVLERIMLDDTLHIKLLETVLLRIQTKGKK